MKRALLYSGAALFLLDTATFLFYRHFPIRGLLLDIYVVIVLLGAFLVGVFCVVAAAAMKSPAGTVTEAAVLRRPWGAVAVSLMALALATRKRRRFQLKESGGSGDFRK